jgi:hypothetical protein
MADLASELEAIAFRLRRAGEQDLPRELNAAMRRAVDPVPDLIRADLKPRLPDRYAETLDEDLDIRTITRNSGSADTEAVVLVYAQSRSGKNRKFKRLNDGLLTHPGPGNDREHWYTQEGAGEGVEPGWFTGPCEASGPRVRAAIERALAGVADKAVKGP